MPLILSKKSAKSVKKLAKKRKAQLAKCGERCKFPEIQSAKPKKIKNPTPGVKITIVFSVAHLRDDYSKDFVKHAKENRVTHNFT